MNNEQLKSMWFHGLWLSFAFLKLGASPSTSWVEDLGPNSDGQQSAGAPDLELQVLNLGA